MLTVKVLEEEHFDEEKNMFFAEVVAVLELEHSLVSLSKWESKHKKPFLSAGKKSSEEIFDYFKAMVVTPGTDLNHLLRCSQKDIDTIQGYIDSSESATTFGKMPERRGPNEPITSELIYYWMVHFNVPFECERWHLNRLFALIRICNIKTTKPTKASRHEIAMRNRELNAQRRKQLNTSG